MKTWIARLASLKLSVLLLLLLSVALAIGTIVESTKDAQAARAVYYAPWFYLLQLIFALNLVAALWERWPRSRQRIGFAVTHAAMLIILAGAMLTVLFKVEGQLALWEGEERSSILHWQDDGQSTEIALPFAIRLDAFEIDVYPGTQRPAMFRSRVTVLDGDRAEPLPAVIEMNRELTYGGFSFFQSSYQQSNGREMSVLSVSRDPGQPVVFLGYVLLVAGMIAVLATRLAARRVAEEAIALPPAPANGIVPPVAPVASLMLVGLLVAGAVPLRAANVPEAGAVEALRRLPVQDDGREMPFDTLARSAVWTVCHQRQWPGIDPVAMVAGWGMDPAAWVRQPIVYIGSGDLAELAGLPRATRWASFEQLTGSDALRSLIASAQGVEREQRNPLQEKAADLMERLVTLQRFLNGQGIPALPAEDRLARWKTAAADVAALVGLEAELRPNAPAHYPSERAIELELTYNAARPSRVAWWILLPASLAAFASLWRPNRLVDLLAAAGLIGGFGAMSWGIAVRWQIAGRIPAANMYESMLFLGWGVGLIAVLAALTRSRLLVANAAAMSALTMVLVDLLPVDPFIHPVQPVLAGTPWLAIHVPIIMVSYSVLALATFIAHVQVGVTIFAPHRESLLGRLADVLYLYLLVGSILLIAGILTGSIWAASSWGRYWGWDPKEVWSLIAFLVYMAILHARFDRKLEVFGVAVASIVAFQTILMTYLGVNYVLAAGLHSYGFGGSNVVQAMLAVAAAEALFLGAAWWAHRRYHLVDSLA